MRKIIIIGCPGAGKSTFARKLRDKLGIELFYLDQIYHKEDRTTISREEFDTRLADIYKCLNEHPDLKLVIFKSREEANAFIEQR